jgi:Ca-activated chloride channel family protein
MIFLSRNALWLMLAVPVLAAAYILLVKRRTPAVICSDLSVVRAAVARGSWIRRHLPPLLFLIAIAALLLATARPAAVVPMLSPQRTIVLAVDTSLSMAATDVAPSRLQAAKAAAKRFIRSQPRDVKLGVVAFAATAEIVQAPTSNRADVERAIDRLSIDYHTAIGSGIIAALQTFFPYDDLAGSYDVYGGTAPATVRQVALARDGRIRDRPPVRPGSFRSGAIVLLTDGTRTMGPDPLFAATEAADRGVRIYTIGFGKAQHAEVAVDGWTVDVGFDEDTLRAVADVTGGKYFHAHTASALAKVYHELSTRFIVEKKEIQLAALLSAAAAALALAAATLSTLWCRRV